jgi:hypothetical protein
MQKKKSPTSARFIAHSTISNTKKMRVKIMSWKHYLAFGLTALVVIAIFVAGWKAFSSASQASLEIPTDDANAVVLGQISLENGVSEAALKQQLEQVFTETDNNLEEVLTPKLQGINNKYDDLLQELAAQYGSLPQNATTADPETTATNLRQFSQSGPKVVDTVKEVEEDKDDTDTEDDSAEVKKTEKRNFFQRFWDGVVNLWKKVFRLSALPVETAYAQELGLTSDLSTTTPTTTQTPTDSASDLGTDFDTDCSTNPAFQSLIALMEETDVRINQLATAQASSSTALDQSQADKQVERLRSLAGELFDVYQAVIDNVDGCSDDAKKLNSQITALAAQTQSIVASLQQNSQLYAWMQGRKLSLRVNSQGQVIVVSSTTNLLGNNPIIRWEQLDAADAPMLKLILDLASEDGATIAPDARFAEWETSVGSPTVQIPGNTPSNTVPTVPTTSPIPTINSNFSQN